MMALSFSPLSLRKTYPETNWRKSWREDSSPMCKECRKGSLSTQNWQRFPSKAISGCQLLGNTQLCATATGDLSLLEAKTSTQTVRLLNSTIRLTIICPVGRIWTLAPMRRSKGDADTRHVSTRTKCMCSEAATCIIERGRWGNALRKWWFMIRRRALSIFWRPKVWASSPVKITAQPYTATPWLSSEASTRTEASPTI